MEGLFALPFVLVMTLAVWNWLRDQERRETRRFYNVAEDFVRRPPKVEVT